MTTIIDVKTYQPKADDVFIFDSNIWLYLFDNLCQPEVWIANSISVYSDFLKKVLNVGAKIYFTAFNVQEISKRLIKHDKKNYIAQFGENDFKTGYRTSVSYTNLLGHINNTIQKIMQKSCPINDHFEVFDCSKFFNADIDFVDEYLSFLAKENNCMLVSHDKDLKNCPFDITILTANSKLVE